MPATTAFSIASQVACWAFSGFSDGRAFYWKWCAAESPYASPRCSNPAGAFLSASGNSRANLKQMTKSIF
jgi:hypothetical protein